MAHDHEVPYITTPCNQHATLLKSNKDNELQVPYYQASCIILNSAEYIVSAQVAYTAPPSKSQRCGQLLCRALPQRIRRILVIFLK